MPGLLLILRRFCPLLIVALLAPSVTQSAISQPPVLPGPAGPPMATTGVVFVQFPEDEGGGNHHALSPGQ